MSPVRLRFFAEEGAESCLWPDGEDGGVLEGRLTIPDDLRDRMSRWITEFNKRTQENVPGPRTAEAHEDFDRRGYELSRELQQVLGPEYEVTYRFRNAAVRRWADTVGAHEPETPPARPTPKVRRLTELLRAVAVLALPPESQRDWLASRGAPLSGDGLVIDLYETGPLAEQFRAAGWMGPRASAQVEKLYCLLQEMSGPDNAHLWTPAALDDAVEWERVRRAARGVVAEL